MKLYIFRVRGGGKVSTFGFNAHNRRKAVEILNHYMRDWGVVGPTETIRAVSLRNRDRALLVNRAFGRRSPGVSRAYDVYLETTFPRQSLSDVFHRRWGRWLRDPAFGNAPPPTWESADYIEETPS